MIIEVFVFNLLTIAESININIKILTVAQNLEFDDVGDSQMKIQRLHSYLYPQDEAQVSHDTVLDVEQSLTLQDFSLPRVLIEEVESRFLTSQDALQPVWPLVEQSLSFIDEALFDTAKGVYTALDIIDSATFEITRLLSVEQPFVISSEAAGYLPSKYWRANG